MPASWAAQGGAIEPDMDVMATRSFRGEERSAAPTERLALIKLNKPTVRNARGSRIAASVIGMVQFARARRSGASGGNFFLSMSNRRIALIEKVCPITSGGSGRDVALSSITGLRYPRGGKEKQLDSPLSLFVHVATSARVSVNQLNG